MRDSDRADRVHRARERFLSDGALEPWVRPEVLASWERCRALDLDPATITPPHRDDVVLDTPLVRAALPVLGRLADRLDLTPTAVLLADADGGIMGRWVGDPSLRAALERVQAEPGAVLAEQAVGTNGLGTPLVAGSPVVISGAEHLKDGYLAFCCAGAPVRDPTDATVLGAVTITCATRHRNALLVPLLLETVEHIERRLGVRRAVARPLRGRPRPLGGPFVEPATVGPMVGESAAWQAVVAEGRRHAASGLPLLVTGEPGTGKAHLVDRLWADQVPMSSRMAAERILLDAARLAIDGPHVMLRRVGDALRAGSAPVLVRHAERCDAATAWAIAALLDETEGRPDRPAVAATSTLIAGEPALHPALRDRLGAVQLTLPPLRDRPADVDVLVAHFTARHGGADHRWTVAALDALRRHDWPGNVRELRNVVVAAVGRHRGDLGVADLPTALVGARAVPFTRLQRLEREAIVEGLRSAGGNKVVAARMLGISRSTLYRKLREYRMP